MADEGVHMCPVFPDLVCPQGLEMSTACAVRISGDFDPMMDFRDHLLLHCAIYQSRRQHSDNMQHDNS